MFLKIATETDLIGSSSRNAAPAALQAYVNEQVDTMAQHKKGSF